MNVNAKRNFYFEPNWSKSYNYRGNQEYLMTATGLKDTKDTTDTNGMMEVGETEDEHCCSIDNYFAHFNGRAE